MTFYHCLHILYLHGLASLLEHASSCVELWVESVLGWHVEPCLFTGVHHWEPGVLARWWWGTVGHTALFLQDNYHSMVVRKFGSKKTLFLALSIMRNRSTSLHQSLKAVHEFRDFLIITCKSYCCLLIHKLQWFRALFRCRIAILNFSMGFVEALHEVLLTNDLLCDCKIALVTGDHFCQ